MKRLRTADRVQVPRELIEAGRDAAPPSIAVPDAAGSDPHQSPASGQSAQLWS